MMTRLFSDDFQVRPVCPLCKGRFKSIIHTIKSDDVYESYTLPPPPQQTPPLPYAANTAELSITRDDLANVSHAVVRRSCTG